MPIKNKIALITGASGGIGKVIAQEFAKEGYDLTIISRHKKELEQTKNNLKSLGGKVNTLVCDISNFKKLKKMLFPLKRIDVLINAAGIQGPIGPISKNKNDDWVETVNINLIGTYNVIYLCLPKIKKGGSIINFSGGGAVLPRQNFSAYAVSKAGVVRLTEILALELKSKDIKVNAIAPGAINTKMFNLMLKAGKNNVGKLEWDKLIKQQKSGGDNPVLAAKLCLWLSGSSNKITGKTISAIYDDWSRWTDKTLDIISSNDWYTMRRIDQYTLDKLEKI